MRQRFLIFLSLVLFSSSVVFADSKSDFEYQYSKYRENIAEFNLFKKDYLTTPSLDNQQKALLTAKLALSTRDLTKASFAAYIGDLLTKNGPVPPIFNSVIQSLLESQKYFMAKAKLAQSIVTLADLEEFDKSYATGYQKYSTSLKVGIVAQKITVLKYFSQKQEESLNSLTQKIPKNVSLRVTERLNILEQDLATINSKLDAMSSYLVSEEGLDNSESEIFFSSKIDLLNEIRSLQLDWLDQLIDLDLTYGKI